MALYVKTNIKLKGYIGKDAENFATKQQKTFTVLSLSTKSGYMDKQTSEWVNHTEWHRIVAFGKAAEYAKNLKKGDYVEIEGELRSTEFDVEVGEGKKKTTVKRRGIEFGNPASFPPDLDRIIISGDGQEPFPASTTYEGELATLSGSASQSFCGNCSGVSTAGNIGDGAQNTVTFTNVVVPVTGTYQMEIDYRTSGPRSFFITVNDSPAQELDLNSFSISTPTSTVIPVQLNAGTNQIEFGNPSNFAPDLDSINIAPTLIAPTIH
jgi:single-stranded DNA-binding protein